LETLPDGLLDTLVSSILQTCPALASTLLSAFGTRVHASAVRVLFTAITIPDDARFFLAPNVQNFTTGHPVSAILLNSDRYGGAVRRITIMDTGLPPPSQALNAETSLGLVKIDEEDSDIDYAMERRFRIAIQPMAAKNLNQLLTVCLNLEEFSWTSSNPPPDGVCEILSEQCLRLISFTFQPGTPLRTVFGKPAAGVSPPTRLTVPKWDAPSLPLLAALPLTKLNITRLSQHGARALAILFIHLGECSLLEDVGLDFVWLDDPLCGKLVEAGRRIRRLTIGTSGTKLTDKGLINIFEGCDSLEDFSLVEAQGRLSRNLWSKFDTLPTNMHKLKIAISESGPHHSWTADHLLSFSRLQLDVLSHLSILRITPHPHFASSSNDLEYDAQIDDIATLKAIPKDIVTAIRGATALIVLECDWWSWKSEDIKILLERCIQLEYIKLAFDAPFTKLLTLTSAFTPLTRLLKLAVSIPPEHTLGPTPPMSPAQGVSPSHPLTPAASPIRRRTSLPSPDSDPSSHFFCTDDIKFSGPADPSLPPTREVKRFVKKCPRLVELEWYGRNARGKWLISRSSTTSKINTNVGVEYHPPEASPSAWKRASLEKATVEALHSGGSLSQSIERQGQYWTGLKAEQFFADRAAEKEKEDRVSPIEKPSKSNGTGKRFSNSLTSLSANAPTTISTDRRSASTHSPVQPFTPLSPPTSTKSFAPTDNTAGLTTDIHLRTSGQSTQSPRRTPSEPSLRNNGAGGSRARSATASGTAQGGPGSTHGRNGNSGSGNRDGRGRGINSSGKSSGGGRSKRNSSTNGG
ncbi:hypothetical protein K439DRAFT_1260283, partial [Ramaria rubella]